MKLRCKVQHRLSVKHANGRSNKQCRRKHTSDRTRPECHRGSYKLDDHQKQNRVKIPVLMEERGYQSFPVATHLRINIASNPTTVPPKASLAGTGRVSFEK